MLVLKAPVRRLEALAYSPDGAELAAGGHTADTDKGGLFVWSLGDPTAAPRHLLPGLPVDRVGYSDDGRWLVAAGGTRTQRHDLPALANLFDRKKLDAPPRTIEGGPRFALAGDRVHVAGWSDVPAGRRATSRVASHRLDAGGKFPLLWEVEWKTGSEPWGFTGMSDGRAVALDWYNGTPGLPVYTVTVRDADTGKSLGVGPHGGSVIGPLVASPDGGRVVLLAGSSLFVWRTDDMAAQPKKVPYGKKHCYNLAFSPDGRSAVATSSDGTARRLDTDTWQPTATYSWTEGKALGVAVSPDGLTAAVGTSTGKVIVFDLD